MNSLLFSMICALAGPEVYIIFLCFPKGIVIFPWYDVILGTKHQPEVFQTEI